MTVLRALLFVLLPGVAMFPATSVSNATPDRLAQAKPRPDAWGCHKWDGLSHDHAQRIVEIAAAAALQANVVTPSATEPTSFWVFLPPAPDRAAARKRVAELKRAGITDYFVMQKQGPQQFAISLGVFNTRGPADNLVQSLRLKGIRDAQVGERGAATKADVDLRGPAASIAAAMEKIVLELPEAKGSACAAG